MNNKITWKLPLLTALLASSILCLLMPLSMYDSNPSEFPMTAYSELLFYSCVLLVLVAIVFFLLFMAVKRWLPRFLLPSIGFLFGVSVALYAQGNLIGANYGALDGHVIQWELMRTTAIVNTLIWIACVSIPVLVMLFARRVAEKCLGLAVPILLAYVSLLSIMLFFANISAFDRKKLAGFTFDKFMELSSERNLVVIILDSFDRAIFDRLLEDDPIWRSRFAGFTYYHNTVSAYCYTVLALPQIVSGYGRPEEMTIWEYQRKAYSEAPFLRRANELGFAVDAYYDENVCPLEEELDGFGRFGNSVDNAPRFFSLANIGHYASLYYCAAFRYLPHLMKKWWVEHQDEFKERFYFDSNSMFSSKVELALAKGLKQEQFTLVPDKKIKFYHCASLHVPRFNLETARENLDMVCRFIDRTREASVYERTDFVIMADHGSINRCRPLFMCSNGTSEFKVTEMPFSYRHLCEAFLDSLNGGVITPIVSDSSGMIPIIDDPKRISSDIVVDEKVFPEIGTEFSGKGLELLATTAELDVVATEDGAKMTWNGKQASLWVPVEQQLQDGELCLRLTFDKTLSDANKPSLDVHFPDETPQSLECSLEPCPGGTIAVVKLPKFPDNIDKRIVKLILHQWDGDVVPSITKVKIGLCE